MELSLSDRFPSLSPFTIRKERASEVFLLMRRLNNSTLKNNKKKSNKIRRHAGDNWF